MQKGINVVDQLENILLQEIFKEAYKDLNIEAFMLETENNLYVLYKYLKEQTRIPMSELKAAEYIKVIYGDDSYYNKEISRLAAIVKEMYLNK